MSDVKYARESLRPGSDGAIAIPAEISCVFKFDELETNEIMHQQADHHLTLNSAADYAAIVRIKNQLKLSSSLQVHSSDGSLISVFNSEAVQDPSSTTYTNLETSLDIPVGDPSFIQHLLNNTSSFSELEFGDDLFKDIFDEASSFEPLTDLNPEMILQQSSQPPLPTSLASDHLYAQSDNSSYMNDEQGLSSPSCVSDVSERSDMNRRKTKKPSKTIPDGKLARFGNKQVVKYSQEYEDRRVKNNEAVKKSRMKAKEKQKSSEGQMQKLSEENRRLSDRVELLMKELQVLRSLYKDLKPDGSKSKGSEPMNTQ